MRRVSPSDHHTILAPDEGPTAEVLNAQARSSICLVCEHASSFVPRSLNNLGLAAEHRRSHAAWDIGALDLAKTLSTRLSATLVISRVSRLVYDCNRPPSAPDAMIAQSEKVAVPGNMDLTEQARSARAKEIYQPFRTLLQDTLDGFRQPPIMVTLHSFTPVWHGKTRNVELGLLHDSDDRLAKAMLAAAPKDVDTRLNEPYSATDGVTHTLREHAIPRGLQNVMIEVRNDLVSDATGVSRFASVLADMLAQSLAPQVSL